MALVLVVAMNDCHHLLGVVYHCHVVSVVTVCDCHVVFVLIVSDG